MMDAPAKEPLKYTVSLPQGTLVSDISVHLNLALSDWHLTVNLLVSVVVPLIWSTSPWTLAVCCAQCHFTTCQLSALLCLLQQRLETLPGTHQAQTPGGISLTSISTCKSCFELPSAFCGIKKKHAEEGIFLIQRQLSKLDRKKIFLQFPISPLMTLMESQKSWDLSDKI